MSKEWPALGQEKDRKKKLQPKVGSFAAAVKVQNSEGEPRQEQTDCEGKSGRDDKNLPNETSLTLSWEERNAANKAAKQAQKEEKKIKREENARRKLLAPKG